ncbi:hypothetical protein Gotri_006979 [Gossypium trilobum]|uniref:DUF4219 domain-containing protein n=1 Tax=Gossypium trilobum TaxID=34281 RepID=A0A7J9EEK5_9ROSI|nr:hypothetical protein [Gossypium trilobum]
MSVVQRYTGLSSGNFSGDGDVSPAARLAVTEKASPSPREKIVDSGFMGEGGMEEALIRTPTGILSPAPETLPAVATGTFFTPASEARMMSPWHEWSPMLQGSASIHNETPYFNGKSYSYWKIRVKLFIQANDFHVWRIISNGDLKDTNNEDEWEDGDKRKAQLNAKAIHTLFCVIKPNEYNRLNNGPEVANNKPAILDGGDDGGLTTMMATSIVAVANVRGGNNSSIVDPFGGFQVISGFEGEPTKSEYLAFNQKTQIML